MGCWGIEALASDAGMDAWDDLLMECLTEDGKLELNQMIDSIKRDPLYVVPNATDGYYIEPLVIAELIIRFINQSSYRYEEITSCAVDKKSVRWIRKYVSDTLQSRIKVVECAAKSGADKYTRWDGWTEEDWHRWQTHMSELIGALGKLLSSPVDPIELIDL